MQHYKLLIFFFLLFVPNTSHHNKVPQMIYKIDDTRFESIREFANLPFRACAFDGQGVLVEVLDSNPSVPPHDADGCDTPNLGLRLMPANDLKSLARKNALTRQQADLLLEISCGRKQAALNNLLSPDAQGVKSIIAFYGSRPTTSDLDAIAQTPRFRNGSRNRRLFTKGDTDFPRRRKYYHNSVHPQLLDSSWVGPASKHSSEIQHV